MFWKGSTIYQEERCSFQVIVKIVLVIIVWFKTWRETQLKFQSNVRVDKSNWRLPGDNGERSNNRNEFWTGKSIFRVLRHQEVLPVASCIMDDNLMACVNTHGSGHHFTEQDIYSPHISDDDRREQEWQWVEHICGQSDQFIIGSWQWAMHEVYVRQNLFPISRVQNTWGRTSLLQCKSCPKVHPLWYWCVLNLQVWWQRDTVQLWIHLFIWNWSRRMMTFSPDMGVRSGGDASAATRIASSSLDLAQADLHGTGWTKELVLLLLTWSAPKHVYTGSYGKSFQTVFWGWSSWMLWHYWNYQEVATIGMMNGWKCMIEGTDSHIHDFDGCMYGLKTQFDDRHIPIKKPWRIVSWGVKFDLHKKCDRRHDHGKCEGRETRITQTYTQQIVDIILKTICRNVSIRFKKSLSNGDDICSGCMHDRRSIKKTAVSVAYNNNEVAADLMWLMIFHRNRCRINVDPDFSGHQATGSQSFKTFAASHSFVCHRKSDRKPDRTSPTGSTWSRRSSLAAHRRTGDRKPDRTSPTGSTWTDRQGCHVELHADHWVCTAWSQRHQQNPHHVEREWQTRCHPGYVQGVRPDHQQPAWHYGQQVACDWD